MNRPVMPAETHNSAGSVAMRPTRLRALMRAALLSAVLAPPACVPAHADLIDDTSVTEERLAGRASSPATGAVSEAGPAPSDPRALARLADDAEAAYREQRWDAALDAFRAVVTAQPDHAKAWLRIGNVQQRKGQWLAAASAYRRAADRARRTPDAADRELRVKALLNLAAVNLEMADAALAQAGASSGTAGGAGPELERRSAELGQRLQAALSASRPPVVEYRHGAPTR